MGTPCSEFKTTSRHRPLVVLRNHNAGVTSVKFLAETEGRLASGDALGQIYIHDLNTGRIIYNLHGGEPSTLAGWGGIHALLTSAEKHSHDEHPHGARGQSLLTTGQEKLIVQTRKGGVSVWDLSSNANTVAQAKPVISIDTKACAFARARLLPASGGISGSSGGERLLCLAPLMRNDAVGIYDLTDAGSSSTGAPILATAPLELKPSVAACSSAKTPGWLIGVEPLTGLGPWYIAVAYEAFAAQAVYDLRRPATPVTPPLFLPNLTQTCMTYTVDKRRTWVGTAEGLIVTAKILETGQIVADDVPILDLFRHDRAKDPVFEAATAGSDPLELRSEVLDALSSHSRLGIGVLSKPTKDGLRLLAGCWDHSFKMIDLAHHAVADTVRYHTASISALDIEPRCGALAVGSQVHTPLNNAAL